MFGGAKMIVPADLYRLSVIRYDGITGQHAADEVESAPCRKTRQREQQFIIVAPVEALLESRAGKERHIHDFCAQSRGHTDAIQIDAQSVAKINAGCRALS